VPSFDPTFDYLELLGLTPAKALTTPVPRLRELIGERKRGLTGKEQNPKYQQEARAAKERLLAFEGLLTDPDALEAYVRFQVEQHAARQTEYRDRVTRLVELASAGRDVITPAQKALLSEEVRAARIPDGVLDLVLKRARVVEEAPAEAAGPVGIPRLADALDPAVVSEVHNWLGVLSKPSLYAALDLPDSTSPEALVVAARMLYARWSKALPKTSECTAWEKVALAATTYLKDAAGKGRYDRALFNLRIDQFLRRVDLVLAGGTLGRRQQEILATLGVTDFGLSNEVVKACVAARAAEKGVRPGAGPATVSLEGRVPCRLCHVWNAASQKHCRGCRTGLRPTCANPACRAVGPADAVECPACRLGYAKGVLYASAIALADAHLATGHADEALAACANAERVLPGPDVNRRTAQGHALRSLIAAIAAAAGRKRWSEVRAALPRLHELAPKFRRHGIPRPDAIDDVMRAVRAQLDAVPDAADPVEIAKVALACLGHWSDCDVAHWRLRRAAEALLVEGRAAVAARLARKIIDVHAWDPDLRAFAADLERRAVAAGAPTVARTPPPVETNGHPTAHLRNGDSPTWWAERPAADTQPRL
jgi:hypothetical protein